MIESYERMFGEKPRYFNSPLEKGDHPELDDTPLLDPEQVTEYLSLMGQLQWLISLGRFNVSSAVSGLSTFHSKPCKGHLEHAQSVW